MMAATTKHIIGLWISLIIIAAVIGNEVGKISKTVASLTSLQEVMADKLGEIDKRQSGWIYDYGESLKNLRKIVKHNKKVIAANEWNLLLTKDLSVLRIEKLQKADKRLAKKLKECRRLFK
jgi:hypothetical protein